MKTTFWILKRTYEGTTGYDEADSFVVEARTQRRARRLAADNAGDEGGDTWLDKTLSSCRVLEPTDDERLVLRSFNAG